MEERKYIDAGTDFKNLHFSGELIIGCIRWYLKYPISYRNLEEMIQERGVEVDYTTIYRWVQKYVPELHKRIRWYSQVYSGSWRIDETYIKVKGKWKYLYRAINKYGKTIDFILLHRRDKDAAKRFLKKALKSSKSKPYRINTDKHAPYLSAINELRKEGVIGDKTEHSQVKYLNNIVESDHGRIKRRLRPMLGFKSFISTYRCIKGVETMIMFAKNQSFWITNNLKNQITFINKLFNLYSLYSSI